MGVKESNCEALLVNIDSVEQPVTRHTRWNQDEANALRELSLYGKDVTHNVTEFYSPPRIAGMAERMGLTPGMSFDLTQVDPEDGKPWDFNNEATQNKARRYVRR